MQVKSSERYSRQVSLPEIGPEGQERLRNSKVLIVGAGGLGSPAGFYLAAAGVGTLGLMDGDAVEMSNLQRQIAHTPSDIGRMKVDSAADRFTALNPDTQFTVFPHLLVKGNAAPIIADFDFIIDATDDFAAKFLIADACREVGRPYSHAGIMGFYGQTLTVLPGKTACLRCVFEAPPDPGAYPAVPRGPLGAVPGVIGTIQAAEAIKYLVGCGELLTDRLLTFDALRMIFRTVPVRMGCPACLDSARKSSPVPTSGGNRQ